MSNILIVGYGTVGQNLYKTLEKLHPDIYDKYKTEYNTKRDIVYDYCFICVDTPYKGPENPCDIQAVRAALSENDSVLYIIKSTVLPGTTRKLADETGKRLIFSPEYYGGTQHCNNFDFNFTIIGQDEHFTCGYFLQGLLQQVYDARHTFRYTNYETAELVKYMENAWLATKVTFCAQFWQIANQLHVPYPELRELFILDPRVNPAHTFVYGDHPYWNSHCLNKDVPAIAETFDAQFLKDMIKFNEELKKKDD